MRINYNKQVDALYIRFSEAKYYVSEELKEGIILDLDKSGKVIGLEVLDVSDRLPRETMNSIHFEMEPAQHKKVLKGK